MSVGNSSKYAILKISGRHFLETAKEAGFGVTQPKQAIEVTLQDIPNAANIALSHMPKDFDVSILRAY